ncbi:MAG TPA: class I SAM-dependent methyltransferase [Dehalococcoidia bacterium]|nr:class I SAM-dependent methyltransferase [Dehalococcoidia bacterium]
MAGHSEEALTASEQYAGQLFQLATAYRLSAIFFAALELDLFAHMHPGSATAAALATAVGADETRLRQLLNTLVGMGLVTRDDDGQYLPLPALKPLLCPGLYYHGDQFLRHKESANDWLRLADIVRRREVGPAYYGRLLESASVKPYLESVRETNWPHADAMMAHLRDIIPRLRNVLDIGGGHGYYSERLLQLNPALTITVVDVAGSIAYLRQRLHDHPQRDRFRLQVGDARTLDLAETFDLVLLNNLLQYFSDEEKPEVVRRAARALSQAGTLAALKFRLDETGSRPPSSSLFSLMIMVNTYKGRQETDAEFVSYMQAAGLRDVQALPLNEERTLVLGVR